MKRRPRAKRAIKCGAPEYRKEGPAKWEDVMNNTEIKLERKLSVVNVWALAFGSIIGWSAFALPGTTFLKNAGTLGTLIGMLLAALVMIVIAFNYNYMINKYPISGGEFTYAQAAFGKNHAYICSWFLGLSYIAIVPLNATGLPFIARGILGDVFQFGFSYQVAGYDVYFGEIILAASALIIFAVLGIRGVKFTGIFQTLLTFMLIGGVAVVGIAAVCSPKTGVSNLLPLFSPDKTPIAGILSVLAIAPYAFVGFDTIPQSAEEFKFSVGKTIAIMIIAIVFGGLCYAGINLIAASIVPEGYSGWYEYVMDIDNLTGVKAVPALNAAKELLGIPGLVAICMAVLGALLSGVVGFYMASSRLLYSVAKENMLPKWFGYIHPKYRTPVNAIIFVMVISLIAPFFGRNTLVWIVDMSSVGAAIGYGYTSAAAFKLALKERKKSIMITGALGSAFAVVCAVILLVPIKGLDCSLGMESYICLAVWIIMGIIFYVCMRMRREK